jgi:hypothetical protein
MAVWLHHPAYRPVRDALIARFRSGSFHFLKRQRIAFICGGGGSTRRGEFEQYLKKRRPDTLFFRAEAVWEEITSAAPSSNENVLEVEQRLADLADMVVIIVESAGTLAELGAFAMNSALRPKLVPILDAQHRGDKSFINMGPVHWVDKESEFAPTIYADFDAITRAGHELELRLDKIRRPRNEEITELARNPQHRLFVLWDLIAAIGPVSVPHITYYYEATLGRSEQSDLQFSLGLGLALGVLRKTKQGRDDLYYRDVADGVLTSSFKRTHSTPFDLSHERAKILGVLQVIPSARSALESLDKP